MVDVVSQLPFDPDLLLLFVEGEGMFAVTVLLGLLQPGIEPDQVVRDVAQLVVGKGFAVVDAFTPFGPFGEFIEPRDVVSQPTGSKIAGDAHQ